MSRNLFQPDSKEEEKEDEEERREMADLFVLPRAANSVQNGAGVSRKT